MREISKVVIHHSAVSVEKQPSTKKMITSINRTHKERLKQPDDGDGSTCAYHIFISPDGEIWKTRKYDSVGYANSNREVNKRAINICLHGDCDKDTPTKEQYASLIMQIKSLQEEFKFTVHLHNEFAVKSCPGKNFDFSLVKSGIESKPLTGKRYQILKSVNSMIYKKITDPRIKDQLRTTNKIIRGEI